MAARLVSLDTTSTSNGRKLGSLTGVAVTRHHADPSRTAVRCLAGRGNGHRNSKGPAPPPHIFPRRVVLHSVTAWPLLSLIVNLQQEAALLRQEVEYYRRNLSDKMIENGVKSPPPKKSVELVSDPVDERISQLLLSAPLDILDRGEVDVEWSRSRYDEDSHALLSQELPYLRESGACGDCGASGSLSDRAWVDTLSYIQWKAIAKQLPHPTSGSSPAFFESSLHAAPPTGNPTLQDTTGSIGTQNAIRKLQQAVGRRLLQAAREGTSPDGSGHSALATTSPALADIRRGVRDLLAFFKETGLVSETAIVFFGASRSEPRNFATWEDGEPAFLKYWLKGSVTQQSSVALSQEEGFSQDFVSCAIEAYLLECGVRVSGVKRFQSLVSPLLVAEQATLRRERELPPGSDDDTALGTPFRLDLCPDGQETGCY